MENEIAVLYRNAQKTDSTHTEYIEKLVNMDTRDIEPNYKMNPLIVNKMLKYDFNSLTAALLSYQEAKVNYLYSIADNKIGNEISSFDKLSKTPDAFLNMVRNRLKTDELLKNVKAKTTKEATEKYTQFFHTNYQGYRGFSQYLDDESEKNEAATHNALNNYKDRVLKSHIITGTEKTITHKDIPVFLQITAPASLRELAGYYVHSKTQTSNQRIFLAGTRITDSKKVAFTALVDSAGTVLWLKEFTQPNTNNHAILTTEIRDAFAVVVTDNSMKNSILLLDTIGNIKATKNLPFTSVPQKIVYDDIAQTYVLAFKGNSFMPYSASNSMLQIAMLDAVFEPIWSHTLSFDGYLASIVKTDDNYYVYGAYRRLTDVQGRQYATQANQMNMFVYPIKAEGNWLNVTTFDEPFSYYPLNVVKINNEYLDVISIKDAQPDRLIEDQALAGNPYYVIIHSNSELFYHYYK